MIDIFEKLKIWHEEQHRRDIKSAFELGDMIVTAMINTKMTNYAIIQRIRKELGDMAFSVAYYNRAAKLSRVFTGNQREVIISRGVSLDRAEILAGHAYDGKKRIKYVNDIKTGKIKTWSMIRGKNEAKHLKETEVLRHGITYGSDVVAIQIKNFGEFGRELMHDGLRSLVSQVPQDALTDELNKAIDDCNKRGLSLKRYMQII